jgi:hypothetical protein
MNAAKVRGEELLRLVLLPDELDHYERCMEIVVTGSDGKRYRIDDGVVSNVHLLNDAGGRVAGLCCHPQLYGPDDAAQIPLPHRDAHASQILQLRHDAEAFWQKANIDWYDFNARTEYRRQQYGVHDPEVAHGEAHAENVRRDEIAQRRMRPDPHGWLAA